MMEASDGVGGWELKMGMKGAQGRRSIGDDEYLYVKLVGEALETLLMATTYHFLILYLAPSMADVTGHRAGTEGWMKRSG